jgi:hypothetical protein
MAIEMKNALVERLNNRKADYWMVGSIAHNINISEH